MNTILIITQKNSEFTELADFMMAMISGGIYFLCFLLFGYALYILFSSSNALLTEEPEKPEIKNDVYNISFLNNIVEERRQSKEAEYRKRKEKFENTLKAPIENNKVYALCTLIFFSFAFLILEMTDLLTFLINAKMVIFAILVFANIALAFADNIFKISKQSKKIVIAALAFIISGQYFIIIVLNEERFIIIRLLVGFLLVALNTVNIYALTKKSTSD